LKPKRAPRSTGFPKRGHFTESAAALGRRALDAVVALSVKKRKGGIAMDPTDNLHSLHWHEEQELRAKSVQSIRSRVDLGDHWMLVSEAMNVIYAFSHDHPHGSDNELTLQYLGARLFNAAGASIKLAMSGYYQKAFDQVRDILETYFLVDYLITYPEKIAVWKVADKKQRISQFGPGVVRTALDKRDGYTTGARKKIYDTISEYASHASYRRIQLTANKDNLVEVGPFFDEKKLTAWLQEMAMRLGHAALILPSKSEGNDVLLLATRARYLGVINTWKDKYLPPPIARESLAVR
jgi:hypothetical protein